MDPTMASRIAYSSTATPAPAIQPGTFRSVSHSRSGRTAMTREKARKAGPKTSAT